MRGGRRGEKDERVWGGETGNRIMWWKGNINERGERGGSGQMSERVKTWVNIKTSRKKHIKEKKVSTKKTNRLFKNIYLEMLRFKDVGGLSIFLSFLIVLLNKVKSVQHI